MIWSILVEILTILLPMFHAMDSVAIRFRSDMVELVNKQCDVDKRLNMCPGIFLFVIMGFQGLQ